MTALDQLNALIKKAQTITPTHSAPGDQSDPLAQLDQWIARSYLSNVLAQSQLPESFQALIDAAKNIGRIEIAQRGSGDDPLVYLAAQIKKECKQVGAYSSPQLSVKRAPTVVASTPVDARAQGALLASLGRQDLPGAVRAQAIAMVLAAMDAPTSDALQDILDVLVHG